MPPDALTLPALDGPPVVCDNSRALLVDRFEVARAEWRAWCAEDGAAQDALLLEFVATWAPETDAWPASFMNHAESERFAAARGMRLLTAREWIRVACGSRRQPWPWGHSPQTSIANTLELNLGRPVPTGTFEQGKTPQSICDLLGNVWEWVAEPIRTASDKDATSAWVMGGSYLSRPRRSFELVEQVDASTGRQVRGWAFHEQELHPDSRSADVGLRCAVDAADYLWAHAARFGSSSRAHTRLAAIGRSWGRAAAPLLEELALRPDAPRALTWLSEGARQ